jgi:hypothetical protein
MYLIVGIAAYIAGFTGSLTAWHWHLHGVFSPLQFALAAFCALNVRGPTA